MPSRESWKQAVDAADLHFNSSVVQLRNHHYPSGGLNTTNFANSSKGMAEMTIAAERWYPTPSRNSANGTDDDGGLEHFSDWCHVTQIFQADFYKSQIQFYRRGSGMPERQLGSLYWQLEDIWQAPTWAGIEYDGRWKVLHVRLIIPFPLLPRLWVMFVSFLEQSTNEYKQYTAKDIYQPIIISPFLNTTEANGTFEIYVTSDLWKPATGTAKLSWYSWSGKSLNISTPSSIPVVVGAINSTIIYSTNIDSLLSASGLDPKDVVLKLSISMTGSLPNNPNTQTFTHENWFHPVPLSQANIVDPGLTITHKEQKGKKIVVVEATKGVAAWVWLNSPAQFDDNGFWLESGEKREVQYEILEPKEAEWKGIVGVESLWDLATCGNSQSIT
jgi:beta-mannosidase